MLNLQTHHHFQLDFQKVDPTWFPESGPTYKNEWLIHDTKLILEVTILISELIGYLWCYATVIKYINWLLTSDFEGIRSPELYARRQKHAYVSGGYN